MIPLIRPSFPWQLAMRLLVCAALCAALQWVASCAHESDQQIQQQAQRATEQAKRDAQKAAAQAKVAAANATREANDVAKGVRAGLKNKNGERVLDVNTASRADLETLPGVTPATARRIADNRPYSTPRDLVRKRVISRSEYDRIAPDIVAR
jgi:DNA uptake protein ComE-like DNA-binding protein